MPKILIADDEEYIRDVIREYGEFEGYEVDEAGDGMEAVAKCRENDYDIVIMDIMMPKLDGFSASKEIRKTKNIPVLMLSARGEEYDKLFGFEIGIDDYVVKPFSPKELMARVNVILRRSAHSSEETDDNRFIYEGLEVDMVARTVVIDGEKVMLAPKNYDLLFYLVRNRNKALSRENLLTNVWGYDFYGNDRTVDSHIKLLRNSLGPYRNLIVTLRSMGYKFEV